LARKLALAVVLLLPTLASPALAAKQPGVLGISPPRRIVVARPPVTLPPTVVQNTTQFTFDMTITRGLLTQRLDGSFDIDTSPRNLRAAQLILDTAPNRFVLPPDRQVDLRFRWANIPRGARAVYVGLLVQGVPKAKKNAGVSSILRLLGTNFFRLPGPYRSSAEIVSVRGQQAGPKRIEFFTRVKNTGQVADSPRGGRLRIEDSSGSPVASLPWPPGVILPGYQRDYPVLLKKVLPAGHYTAVSSMVFGRPARRRVKRWPFVLTGPNQLPTRDLSLPKVSLSGSIGDPGHVTATVRNTGTATSPAVLTVTLYRLPPNGATQVKLGSVRRPGGALAVGQSRGYAFDLAKLAKANYRATVVVSDGTTKFDERSANLSPRKREGALTGLWNWIKDNLPWLLLLLAIAAILLLLFLMRRRRDDDDADTPPAAGPPVVPAALDLAPVPVASVPAAADSAAVPAAAAPALPEPAAVPVASVPAAPAAAPGPGASEPGAPGDGLVNLNEAGIEELIALPGIGPRAAQRIVDHREEYGAFRSLDDLREVEGFDEERIQRISDHATL
jgi:competence ComEA-like helix-hairpin-helix protein